MRAREGCKAVSLRVGHARVPAHRSGGPPDKPRPRVRPRPWRRAHHRQNCRHVTAKENKVTCNIEAGTEIKSIALAVGDCTLTELNIRRMLGGSGSDDVGCLAMNGPGFEQPCAFEEKLIDGAAMIMCWSENEVFDKKGTVREALNSLIVHLRHWRHCIIIVGPESAECWGLNPRFDEITEKYTHYPESTGQSASAITRTSTTPRLQSRWRRP